MQTASTMPKTDDEAAQLSEILRAQHDEIEAQDPGHHTRWFKFLDRLAVMNIGNSDGNFRWNGTNWVRQEPVVEFGPEGF